MAAFVFSSLLLMLVEVHRRDLASRRRNSATARYRPERSFDRDRSR